MQSQSAGPASGKYGGFGSKDMEQMGYNNPTSTYKGGSSSVGYDPYVSKSNPPAPAVSSKKEEPA